MWLPCINIVLLLLLYNKSCDTETEKPPPANIKKTSAKSTGNNTHLPTSTFDDDCQGIREEIDSDCESTFKIIEENLLLKRDNKELKDRLIILERVLDQVLRDQEEKRSLKLEKREEFKWKKVQSRHKPSERKQFSLEKSNSFDILSDLEETDNSEFIHSLSSFTGSRRILMSCDVR